MTRRNLELVLLLIASPLVLLMFAMIVINEGDHLSLDTLAVPIGLFGAFVVSHLALRKLAPAADPALLPIVFALSGIGIAYVTRLAPDLAIRQVAWLFAGVFCMLLTLLLVRRVDKVAEYKYTLMFVGVVLLLSPLIPGIGTEIYGSQIWLSIGGFSFQPGEIAKILIVLFLAAYLAQNREMLSVFTHKVGPFHFPDMRTMLPLLVMWGISMVIVIFEKDLGSACVVFLVFLAMLYVASGKKSYLLFGAILGLIGVFVAFMLFSHVQVRVDTWLDPFADPTGTGYQLVQSLYSMADGGLFGTGIGRGMADQIPVVESDFIFAAICEESGLLGGAGILLLFLCFAVRGLVIAARAKSDVSSFIAAGLTSIIILQAFMIVGGVTKLIPLTGLTLPFISQGGSSLLAGFISVGLLLRCGDEATGMGTEIKQNTTTLAGFGVLGRVSLGKRLTNVMIAYAVMFALLIANLTYIMVIQAEYYQNLPGNNHTIARQSQVERGTISTFDGVVLAQSVLDEATGYYHREYPAGTLASHVVGYASDKYGTAGIESSYNEVLQGNRSYASWTDLINSASGIGNPGNDITLTINSTVQQAAEAALEGYKGACIVLDPETGAILAMASAPSYSSSDLEALLAGQDDQTSLYNRATQGLYVPGSTFKIVTLAAAMQDDVANEDSVYDSPGQMEIGGGEVTNYDDLSYGDITLTQATTYSSNTVFGQIGVELGAQRLVSAAESYGFNTALHFDIPTAMSLMPVASEMTTWETAWAADGQPVGEHDSPAGPQATVLQMAMVGAAVANEGVIQTPHLVEAIYNSDGLQSYAAPSPNQNRFASPITPAVARRTLTVLEDVVNYGTGINAAVPGVQIAGKTGTAETGKEMDDSWFVGMGPTNDCSVVVAIVLEEAEEGTAATRSSAVMQAALALQGDLDENAINSYDGGYGAYGYNSGGYGDAYGGYGGYGGYDTSGGYGGYGQDYSSYYSAPYSAYDPYAYNYPYGYGGY